jgi:D-glycero-alpha-D-manno-heptose 1-phosphate guanylyltransferase
LENIVILCGGLGTRVKHITLDKPKLLININGKPFFDHALKIFKKNKIKNIFLLTQHKDEYIKNYIKNINHFRIKVLRDGKKRLGTGGSLKRNLKFLPKEFFLTYGDSYLNFDYSKIKKKFKSTDKNIITIYKNKSSKHKNNILFSNKKILKYNKKKNFNYIDYGLFYFKKSDLKECNIKSKEFDMSEYIKELIRKKKLGHVISRKKFQECGSIVGINSLRKILKI